MHGRVAGPSSERLSLVVEQDAEETPQQHQRAVCHDWWDKSSFFDPRGNELGEAVAPDVLVDGDGNEEGASDGFVRVYGVGGYDGGD